MGRGCGAKITPIVSRVFKRLSRAPREGNQGGEMHHLHALTICGLVAFGASTSADERDMLNDHDAAEVMETTLFGVIDAISYSEDPDRYAKACGNLDADTAARLPQPHSTVYDKIANACAELPGARTPDETAFWRWGILRPSFLWICAHADHWVRQRVAAPAKWARGTPTRKRRPSDTTTGATGRTSTGTA